MRKKLDTRFPAARIKKIMQTDEDVEKIAMAVPVLVSKALELFLHGLCRRTHDITLQRGGKTINSVHLKQCVQNFNELDFLRETVSRVPDLGSSDGGADDRSAAKRRKTNDNEDHVVDEESKKSRMNGACHTSTSGRGRGRGAGRGNRTGENGMDLKHEYGEGSPELHSPRANLEDGAVILEFSNTTLVSRESEPVALNDFDLNVDWEQNEGVESMSTAALPSTVAKSAFDISQCEFQGWPLRDMEGMTVDSNHFTSFSYGIGEREEDYDADAYDEERRPSTRSRIACAENLNSFAANGCSCKS
ncbi:Dr1-associated corepressor-like protein [Drosera capensis]